MNHETDWTPIPKIVAVAIAGIVGVALVVAAHALGVDVAAPAAAFFAVLLATLAGYFKA